MIKIKKFVFGCIWFVGPIFSIYRPYDVYRPDTSSLAEGGTGVANPNNISGIVQNPAYAVSAKSSGISFALDAQTRITRLAVAVSLKPQYLPIVNLGWQLDNHSAMTIGLHSPFQRVFLNSFFLAYAWEVGYARTLMRYLDIGVSIGTMLGIEAKSFVGWGVSSSFALLSQSEYINLGLFFRLASKISYSSFSRGVVVTESTPHILRIGVSKNWAIITITLEMEYIFWRSSSFQEFGLEMAPRFQPHFLDFLHPHLGFSFEIPQWSGINIKTGFFTEDYFDSLGNNQRQILWSMGLGGLAYSDYWNNQLEINFVYVSSSIFSLFWSENNQIEKFQISFNYYFKK